MAAPPKPASATDLVVQGITAIEGMRSDIGGLTREVDALRDLLEARAATLDRAATALATIAENERRRMEEAAADRVHRGLAWARVWATPGVPHVAILSGLLGVLAMAKLLGLVSLLAPLLPWVRP